MSYYPALAFVLLVYMSFWFLVSLIRKRNDVADIAWGLGFILLSWSGFLLSGFSIRACIVNSLVTVWGSRLAWHIYTRNRNKTEDYRYMAWRKEWGRWFYIRSYLQVYLLQGIFLFIIVLPVLYINSSKYVQFQITDIIGLAVWLIGFYFESTGDRQLKQFVSSPNNKGKIMDQGLWRYTRHPNYFGEVTLWWGIWLLSVSIPNGFFTIVGPLAITVLILFVSGIPMLEKKYDGRPDWEEYKNRTSVFFPLPPKNF